VWPAWLQVEKPQGFKCGTFGASGLEDRHLATGDYAGNLNIWCVLDARSSICAAPLLRRVVECCQVTDASSDCVVARCRDLERMDAPLFSAKAHRSIVNNIDGCGGLRIGQCCVAGRRRCDCVCRHPRHGALLLSCFQAAERRSLSRVDATAS
jgi:hypothetical protein